MSLHEVSDDEYMNNLVKEAHGLLEDTNSESLEDSKIIVSKDSKPVYKPRINKPLLALGCVMALTVVFVNKFYRTDSKNLQDNTIEYTDSIIDSGINDKVSIFNNESVIEVEDESSIKPMEGKHLTNLPVVVTNEVDRYFKKSIEILKVALSVDTFIANNDVYGDKAFGETLYVLVNEFNEKYTEYSNHSIPDGCDEYDYLVNSSLEIYDYYFNKVIEAISEESREEYVSMVNAAVSYVKTKQSGLTAVSDTWQTVFIYYGLFDGG